MMALVPHNISCETLSSWAYDDNSHIEVRNPTNRTKYNIILNGFELFSDECDASI